MKKLTFVAMVLCVFHCAEQLPPGVCAPVDEPFRAGQTIDAGRIHVTNDADKIYVAYEVTGGWELNKTHINFSSDLADVPRSGGGAPVNGQFTFQNSHIPAVTQFVYTYPLANIVGGRVIIMTHAEVQKDNQTETAYGGSQKFPGTNRWAFYTEYRVCQNSTGSLTGVTYLDINQDNVQAVGEPNIPTVPVVLQNAQGITWNTVSDVNGSFRFEAVPDGNYSLKAGNAAGFTGSSKQVVVSGSTIADLPLVFNYADFCHFSASGFTIGYWKNNLEKAIAGTTAGTQVDAENLQRFVNTAAGMALEPLGDLTFQNAVSRMNSTSSAPADLLTKQLVASELNLASGAVTQPVASIAALLIHQAEFMLRTPSGFSSAELLNMKDWLDAYNNTHGGNFVHASCH